MIVTITIVLIVLQRNCNSHLTRRSVFHLGPTVLHALLSVLISPCLRKSGQSRKSKKLFRFALDMVIFHFHKYEKSYSY